MFRYPWLFFAVLPGLILLIWRLRRLQTYPAPGGDSWKTKAGTLRARFWWVPDFYDLLVLLVLVFLLAGPESPVSPEEVSGQGLSIAVVLDRSGSMGAYIKENNREETRFDGVKRVLRDFFRRRQDDAITLLSFARRPATHTPLTSNAEVLSGFLDLIPLVQPKLGSPFDPPDPDASETGTNMGDALVLAAARLNNGRTSSEAPPGVIILLTDGRSNVGDSTPEEAARIAASLGIRIYSVGLGGVGFFKSGNLAGVGQVDLDVKTLKAIAQITGGEYFQADTSGDLEDLFRTLESQALAPLRQIKNPPRTLNLTPGLIIFGIMIFGRSWFRYGFWRRIAP